MHPPHVQRPEFRCCLQAGNSSDLREALREASARYPRAASLCLVGFSAGSGLLLRILGEAALAGGAALPRVTAAVGISPAYAVPAAWSLVRSPYNEELTRRSVWHFVERHAAQPGSVRFREAHPAAFEAALRVADLSAFHATTYQLAGFTSEAEMCRSR